MGVRWSRMSWSERNELWARWGGASHSGRLRMGCGVRRVLYTRSSQRKAALRPAHGGDPGWPSLHLSAKKFHGSWRAVSRYERSVGCSAGRRRR